MRIALILAGPWLNDQGHSDCLTCWPSWPLRRCLKAKRIMHYAAEEASMKLLTCYCCCCCCCMCCSMCRSWKAKRIMHYAAEEAGMKLTPRHDATAAADARGRDQDRAAAGGGASAVVLIHEQEAVALTACRDPCRDVPTLKVHCMHMMSIINKCIQPMAFTLSNAWLCLLLGNTGCCACFRSASGLHSTTGWQPCGVNQCWTMA